ncbi:hypothetical protein OH76DRAFT_1398424 [Lentinus brumalis]|uniref:Uncharacterized protein n=1 Tax=Lentinus brumalis TaxID=2498619 RepID=A0A371DNJ8_9APHY|nr:hypothetical protein OH76DRAFT_1398424 [Polyporus brumalis]
MDSAHREVARSNTKATSSTLHRTFSSASELGPIRRFVHESTPLVLVYAAASGLPVQWLTFLGISLREKLICY